jgi:hypothetical protein
MTAIIKQKLPSISEYLQHDDKFVRKLEGDLCRNYPTHPHNRHNCTNRTLDNKQALSFILTHFEGTDFPRRISTRTTKDRQILVNDKPQALARFKQANWLDCRISAYTDLDDFPNFLFVDIDTQDLAVLRQVLDRCAKFGLCPTVLFTGSGYHVYQPVRSVRLHEIDRFAKFSLSKEELANRFLRDAESYISGGMKDPNHNPSLKSCMVRVPKSLNSKNGQEVTVMQEWDGNRSDITPLLGIFYSWLATRKITESNRIKPYTKSSTRANTRSIKWIDELLNTPLDDYRKTIVNLILTPYLINIRKLQYEAAFTIIESWLELCGTQRKLNFDTNYLINVALSNAQKRSYKPMRLDTLKVRNFAIYERLGLK